jgi:hypothetical protein
MPSDGCVGAFAVALAGVTRMRSGPTLTKFAQGGHRLRALAFRSDRSFLGSRVPTPLYHPDRQSRVCPCSGE